MGQDSKGGGIGNLLAQLGGADLQLLRQTSNDKRQRFIQLALTLMGTAAVAGISMWFAIFDMVISPQAPFATRVSIAVLAASGWALLIFNLDRVLVLSMSKNESVWLNVAVAIPRLAMALLIGAVVSTPLTLAVFQGDIMKMVSQQQMEDNADRDRKAAMLDDVKEAAKLKAAIEEQQRISDGTLPPGSASLEVQAAQANLNDLNDRIKAATTARRQADLLFQCDYYGDPTGSIREQLDQPGACAENPGPNGLADKYKADVNEAALLLASLNGQLPAATQALEAAREGAADGEAKRLEDMQKAAAVTLKELRTQLAPIQARIDKSNADWNSTSQDATGILSRLEALETAATESASLRWAQRLLWLTFAMIEILPVTVKLLTLFGKPTSYDIMSRLREEAEVSRAELLQRDELDALENDQLVRQEINQDMLVHERAIGLETNSVLADSLRDLSRKAARQWERTMTDHYDASGVEGN